MLWEFHGSPYNTTIVQTFTGISLIKPRVLTILRQLGRPGQCFLWLLNKNWIWLRYTNLMYIDKWSSWLFLMTTEEYKKNRRFSCIGSDVQHLVILRWNWEFCLLFSVPILRSLSEILGTFPLPLHFCFLLYIRDVDYTIPKVFPVIKICDSTICCSFKEIILTKNNVNLSPSK